MTNPTYDINRQVFALSLLSNRAMDLSGTQAALLNQLQLELSAFIQVNQPQPTPLTPNPDFVQQFGAWELVWGPGGVSGSSGDWQVLNSAMYVAYCPAASFPGGAAPCPTYVVAIAATNPASAYDWVVEDAWVKDTVAFAGWDPLTTPYPKYDKPGVTTALIAMGTALGVGQLLGLTAPAGAAGAGQTLVQFLAGVTAGANIVFCGHSLAGALSPTLALYLQTQGTLAGFDQVLVYPTAGPTPGNAAFATLYENHFEPTSSGTAPYQVWNRDLCNTLDIVPHAWAAATLAEIPTLYGNTVANAPAAITKLVAAAEANAAASHTLYTRIPNVQLQGQVFSGTPYVVPPTTTEEFLLQALQQHMTAYWGDPNGRSGLILADGLPEVSVPLLPGVTQIGQQALLAALEQKLDALPKRVK